MKLPITLIVLTKDEEQHIRRCLESVADFVEEMIVVDSGSTDKTAEIAKELGAKVVEHEFTTQAEQFNWALDNVLGPEDGSDSRVEINGEWVLRLDADEYVLPGLADEIKRELHRAPEDVGGYFIKRRMIFMGRWIKHGMYYPMWILRLFRTGWGRSEERAMDEHVVLTRGEAAKLQNDFVDENLNDLSWWTAKHNGYASREAEAVMLANSKGQVANSGNLKESTGRRRWMKDNVYYILPPFIRPALYWFYRYFIRLGFLDGKEGLIFHFLHAFWYRFLVDSKLFELRREKSTKKNF